MKQILIAAGFAIALTFNSFSTFAQTQSREDLLREVATKRAELSQLENALLAPSDEDRARYADFLRLPDTRYAGGFQGRTN
jgi:hypothetical protein